MRQSIRKRPVKGLVKAMTALALALMMVIGTLPEGAVKVKADNIVALPVAGVFR